MSQRETYFVIGDSRTGLDNAITHKYGSFYIACEVDAKTGEIVGFDCTHTLDLTADFLRRLFLGKCFGKDTAQLDAELCRRYHGSSQKAVLVSMRDAEKRFFAAREKAKPTK